MNDDRIRALGAALRRPAVLATIGTLTLALILGGLLWTTNRPSETMTADATTPPSTGWASLAPSPTEGSAALGAIPHLSAFGAQGGVVPLETGFRLETVDGTSASSLVANLTVEPAVAWSTQIEDGDRAVVMTPSEPLRPGYVYKFNLKGTTGELLETWAFQASQPVRVVTTVPENQSTDVPLDTGIEITFDQDGIVDAAEHMTISPATKGRFEQHERTIAFVPEQRLKPATLYTVTVTKGITAPDTGQASVEDTRFRFETVAIGVSSDDAKFAMPDDLVESAVAERPAFGVWYAADDAETVPDSTPVEVFRLGDLDAGIAAFRTIRARPDWSRWSAEGIVSTAGLDRVVFVKGRLQPYQGAHVIRLPEALPAGWYLIQLPHKTHPAQAVLQVTDVAGYLSISRTQSLVWANDVASGRPVVGAAVSSGGSTIGTTDADGLAMGPTPAGLLPQPTDACDRPCDPVVTVVAGGRSVFLPATSSHDKLELFGGSYSWSEADRTHWALLHTDRDRYRSTDTVNAWAVIRRRDDGAVPASVALRLTPESYDDDNVHPPTMTVAATPDASGTVTTTMKLAGVAEGQYRLDLVVDDEPIRTTYLTVAPIIKPAYRLEVVTGRRVYIAGDRIRINVQASFFEGTPVPGVPLRIDGYVERTVTTDAAGQAIHRTTAIVGEDQGDGPESKEIGVSPARAEEGEIDGASRQFYVFPSSRTISADAVIEDGRVNVTGAVHLVDVEGLEAAIADGRYIWDLDPRGAPVRGATVTIRFVELIPVRTQTGTEYDFIEKKVVPVYETRIQERVRGDVQVKTSAGGAYDASIPASTADHEYEVRVSVGDPDGHRARTTAYASRHAWESWENPSATLGPTTGSEDDVSYGIGDRVDLTMSDPARAQRNGDGTRYLFYEAQGGLRSAIVQASPRYVGTFEAWAAPNKAIGSVRFTGSGYASAAYNAPFRTSDRHLTVQLASMAPRYAPGDTATVSVRTLDASGTGTPATVVLRAVDEKLFAMGAASEDDPLDELYVPLDSGLTGAYASHRAPTGELGGGDTTGGGGDERVDFRDTVLFRSVDTDANGRATVSFKVSDDLTSWHVSASAVTSDLEAGFGSVLVPVGLPFFVDASLASEYLLADRPSIPVRVFGTAMEPGDAATIRVTAPGLAFDSGRISVEAFDTTVVPLPDLKLGTQTITFSATTGSGSSARSDSLTRTFDVVRTRLTTTDTAYVRLPHAEAFEGGTGLTRVFVSDAGSGRYVPLLTDLAAGGGARLDRGLAADISADLLADAFGMGGDPVDQVVSDRYQAADGGMTLLPYSSSDLELSCLVALFAPDRVDRTRLTQYLTWTRGADDETRERQMFALAGLAGLGESVLPAIRTAAADPSLTVRERLMIGLGAARLGDTATARDVQTALRDEFGERAGTMARLRVGTSTADITAATALMAVLAAAVGDDLAPAYQAYVDENPSSEQLHALHASAFVSETLARLPVRPVSFSYTVAGVTDTVDLDAARSFELSLTATELASLTIEPITGTVGVATSWLEPVDAADLAPDPDVTITRTVSPGTTIDPDDLLSVSLTVAFGPQAAAGCHEVTELVPSGLAVVGPSAAWISEEEEDQGLRPFAGVILPYDTSGSRVSFCAEPTKQARTVKLRYYARVMAPGTYRWEPAIALSRSEAGVAAQSRAGSVAIR